MLQRELGACWIWIMLFRCFPYWLEPQPLFRFSAVRHGAHLPPFWPLFSQLFECSQEQLPGASSARKDLHQQEHQIFSNLNFRPIIPRPPFSLEALEYINFPAMDGDGGIFERHARLINICMQRTQWGMQQVDPMGANLWPRPPEAV